MVSLNYETKHIGKNKFSRPGNKLLPVKAFVVHYTANHGGTAENHFSYFSNLKGRYASAHIFVDRTKSLEIIPVTEVAFHANERKEGPLIPLLKATAGYYPGGNANLNTIGIEMCMEKDGSIHPNTIDYSGHSKATEAIWRAADLSALRYYWQEMSGTFCVG